MIWQICLLLYLLLVAALIYNLILDYSNSNPVKTICWIFVLVFVPVVGAVAFYMVGRNIGQKRSKTRKLREQFYRQHKCTCALQANDPLYARHTELKRLIFNVEHSPVFPGNRIEVYPGGKIKFEHLLKDIADAREHIHIFYFTIGDDTIGGQFKDNLIEKVRSGVSVRLIYDGLGCNQTNLKYFRHMQEAGVEVNTFLPLSFPRIIHSINYRNHRKIVIIDGQMAYTGGINVKDEYIDGLPWGRWNDIHFKIEGPAAQGLQSVFLADWFYVSGEYLSADTFFPACQPAGRSPVQIVSSEPFGLHSAILEAMFTAITRARKSVYIETPYFVPTSCLLRAIQTAAMSGIDVRLIIPKRSDNGGVQHASNTYIESLLRHRVKVYRYADGFTHSKLMVVDDELVIAGSTNLDIRSLELNFETNVFIYDAEVAQEVKEVYLRDLAVSEAVELEQWIARSKWTRFKEACFRLVSPLY